MPLLIGAQRELRHDWDASFFAVLIAPVCDVARISRPFPIIGFAVCFQWSPLLSAALTQVSADCAPHSTPRSGPRAGARLGPVNIPGGPRPIDPGRSYGPSAVPISPCPKASLEPFTGFRRIGHNTAERRASAWPWCHGNEEVSMFHERG